MACNCNCKCKNGSDSLDFLTPGPGGTEASATYMIGLTHNTCGGRNLLVNNPTKPVIAQLTATPIGTPVDLGNDMLCQECLIAGTVTYCPCGACSPQTEYVSMNVYLPCSEATSPTLTIGKVAASPKPETVYVKDSYGCCCQQQKNCTKQIALTTSINVASAAGASANG